MTNILRIPGNSQGYLETIYDASQDRFDVIRWVYNYVNPELTYHRSITIDHTKVEPRNVGERIDLPRVGWTATADSQYTTYSPQYAVDKIHKGEVATNFWASDATYPHHLIIDFGQAWEFNKIIIDASNDGAVYFQDYEIYVSDNGTDWGSAIKTGTNTGASIFTVTLDDYVTKRYVKIKGTSGTDAYMRISEVWIAWDTPDNTTPDYILSFRGTYSYLKTVANGGNVENANGYDIWFTSDAAGLTQLAHEMEFYDPTTGEIHCWIRIPSISPDTDTVIYIWYGDSSKTSSQEDKATLWESYIGVFHFGDGATLSVDDSTGTSTPTNQGATAVAGSISEGAAQFVAASSQYIDLGDPLNTDPQETITISAWVYLDSAAAYQRLLSNLSGSPYCGYEVYFGYVSGSGVACQLGKNTAGTFLAATLDNIGTGAWVHIVAAVCMTDPNDTNVSFGFGINDAFNVSYGLSGPDAIWRPENSASNMNIGRYPGGTSNYLDGKVDELRIHRRSLGLPASNGITEYANYTSPSTFYSISGEL